MYQATNYVLYETQNTRFLPVHPVEVLKPYDVTSHLSQLGVRVLGRQGQSPDWGSHTVLDTAPSEQLHPGDWREELYVIVQIIIIERVLSVIVQIIK